MLYLYLYLHHLLQGAWLWVDGGEPGYTPTPVLALLSSISLAHLVLSFLIRMGQKLSKIAKNCVNV